MHVQYSILFVPLLICSSLSMLMLRLLSGHEQTFVRPFGLELGTECMGSREREVIPLFFAAVLEKQGRKGSGRLSRFRQLPSYFSSLLRPPALPSCISFLADPSSSTRLD